MDKKTTFSVGIDAMSFYTSRYYLDLKKLAERRAIDPEKFTVGLGQLKMSVPAPDEDVVTLGANAAKRVLQKIDNLNDIDTILFATESGVDFSKAAGIYIHKLLGFSSHCRVLELKQACYAGTGALQLATAWVTRHPNKKVLLIASDISRYELGSAGESSQGAGAVAMIISANPRLLVLESAYGLYTDDVMDFFRPPYMDHAIVDGRYSTLVYLRALEAAWKNFIAQSDASKAIDLHCYHTPVPRLVEKAHKVWSKLNGKILSEEVINDEVADSLQYARQIGNSYAAALYVSLASLLDYHRDDMSGKRVGFYSYGSGCVAEYFTGIVQPTYRDVLDKLHHQKLLKSRQALTVDEYEAFYRHTFPKTAEEYSMPKYETGEFRLSSIKNHERVYEAVEPTKKKRIRTCLIEGEPFVVKALSPGKLILSGEHSVVYGGPALALAVNRFTETTISPRLSKMISFHLLTFQYKDSFTIKTLREIKNRLLDQYQLFVQGQIGIRDVLKAPFELAEFALISMIDHFNSKIIDGLNVQTRSDIPVGCGMGSSAAMILSMLYAISRYCKLNLNHEKCVLLAGDIEKMQHGKASVLDISTLMQGGCVYFKEGVAAPRALSRLPLYIVNTGTPESGTGECVERVRTQFENTNIWSSFASVTQAMNELIANPNVSELQRLIQENHRLLVSIGVVPEKVQSFISSIERAGAAAKVCGAGAVRGEKAGVVLIMTEEPKALEPICHQFGYTLMPVEVESRGVHVV